MNDNGRISGLQGGLLCGGRKRRHKKGGFIGPALAFGVPMLANVVGSLINKLRGRGVLRKSDMVGSGLETYKSSTAFGSGFQYNDPNLSGAGRRRKKKRCSKCGGLRSGGSVGFQGIGGKKQAKRKSTSNPWIAHVKQYKASHPGLTFTQCLKEAKKTYKK